MGRKQFAKDAKNVRHFKLVSRSANDRFADDPDAPPLVLEPFVPPGAARRAGVSEAELMQVPESFEAAVGAEVFGHVDSDREENGRPPASSAQDFDPEDLDGDCYFPRDGYNYEQHLKRCGHSEKGGGVVGAVIEAKPQVPKEQLAMQPAQNEDEMEVLRALENAEEYDEFDEEEENVEEIFGGVAEAADVMLWGPTALEDQDLPDLALFKAMRQQRIGEDEEFEDDDEQQGGAAGRRPSESVNDQDFAQFMADEYGEEEIGACDDEEIAGNMSIEKCEAVLDEYLSVKKEEAERLHSMYEPIPSKRDNVPRVIEETRAIIEKHYSKEEEDEDTSSGEDSEGEDRLWDCETVLSTLSNLSNRPGKIGRIKVVKKPAPALKAVKEDGGMEVDEKEEDEEDEGKDIVELPDVNTTRLRGETAEEKRARKASVKEMRRVCRRMKKDSKDMYKSEAAKLPMQTGPDVRGKTRCHKL